MKHARMREHWVSTVLVCLLVVTFGNYGFLGSTAYSTELSVPEKALTFLTDVVKLDIANYNVKLVGVMDDGPFSTQIVKYTLESEESKLDVLYTFRENAMVWCKLYPFEGSPLFTQPTTTALEEAKSLLERYRTYSSVSYIQELRIMLNSFTKPENDTTTAGDVRLEISIIERKNDIEKITWMKAVNGITNNYDVVILSFRNGTFESFCDSWNLHKIGSADVNVDEEEAVRIAVEQTQKHSWTAGNITVSNITIADMDEAVLAKLLMQPRNDNALYPMWQIQLGLDKVYPGGITEIKVFLWADTGEVAEIARGGSYGAPPSEEPPTTPSIEPLIVPPPEDSVDPTTPPTETPPDGSTGQTNTDPTPLIIAAPIVLAIILGAVFYSRRKKGVNQHTLISNNACAPINWVRV